MTEQLTADQIEKQYSRCLVSVNIINKILNGDADNILTDPKEREYVISINIKYLENKRQSDFWTNEDMTPIDEAIASGNAAIVR